MIVTRLLTSLLLTLEQKIHFEFLRAVTPPWQGTVNRVSDKKFPLTVTDLRYINKQQSGSDSSS